MKWQASSRVFSLVFGAVYFSCFIFGAPLFTYYPELNKFHVGSPPDATAIAILWYGWVAAAVGVSLVAAILVPPRWADSIGHQWSWIVPAVVVAALLIYESRWFL